jgi:hypothetical protein
VAVFASWRITHSPAREDGLSDHIVRPRTHLGWRVRGPRIDAATPARRRSTAHPYRSPHPKRRHTMGCCGHRRAVIGAAPLTNPRPAAAMPPGPAPRPASTFARTPAPAPPTAASTKLHYLERSPILVHGPVTGRPYAFSGERPVQVVDGRDADVLLQTRFFRRAF